MVKLFPIIFILLWSSAFITTKPLVDNSDPFSALAFRFFIVARGFYIFSIFKNQKIIVGSRYIIESMLSGVLFHGFYLGGVFYSISLGLPTGIAALIVTLQPVLTNILAGPVLNEKITFKYNPYTYNIFFNSTGIFIQWQKSRWMEYSRN